MNLDHKSSTIALNKHYRLENTDGTRWVLRKYTGINTKTGDQVWQFVANWMSLESALCGLIERQIKAAGPVTLAEAVKACRSASQVATKILSGRNDG